jgi:hypothetical protein
MQAQEDRRSAMLDLARRWRDSGTGARLFAQEHGITPWTLYYWRKQVVQLERPTRRRRRSRREVTLAPVQVMAAGVESTGDLEIIFVSGDRLRVSADASVETLRRVVQALRTAC